MANQLAVNLSIYFLGDNSQTVFKFDLEKDSYSVGETENWDRKVSPNGALSSVPSAYSVSLMGSIVTVTFVAAPSGIVNATLWILFPTE